LGNANLIYHKGCQQEYAKTEELSLLYCGWAEMHIRHGNLGSAVNVIKYAVKKDLKYNTHAWQLCIDLLESGESEETKDAYEFCL
jgi:hypothetical protein